MRRADSAARRFLAQPEMRAVFVIVTDVFTEKAFQMPLVEHDHMVKQVAPTTLHPALGDSVLPGTSIGSTCRGDAQGFHGGDYFRSEFRVAVEDQIFVREFKGKCFAQLLHDPVAGRIAGYVEMQNAPAIMAQNEKTIEHFECGRVHGEKIHRGNCFAVVPEECFPPVYFVGISWSQQHPARNGAFRNIETKHLQFPVNPRRAPGGIFGDHFEDKFAQILADSLSSHASRVTREPSPVHTEACTMPADNSLRAHQYQRPLPAGPKSLNCNPEQFVEGRYSRFGSAAFQYGELLPKNQILQQQFAARMKSPNQNSKDTIAVNGSWAGVISDHKRQA